MQNNFVTDAINLKSYNLSESDKIIVMYSKDKGLIRGVAKGVKKPKSKLGARMDLLVANTLMLHKGKNLDTICQAEVLNTFNKTRQDIDKIFYSMYVTEVVNNFGLEEDPSSEHIYNLLYKTLNAISTSNGQMPYTEHLTTSSFLPTTQKYPSSSGSNTPCEQYVPSPRISLVISGL